MGVEKELTFRLTIGDMDKYDRITPYSISNMFQEIASLHADDLGCGYDFMINKSLAWIVVRNRITLYKSKSIGKVVKVKTWPHPNGRFDFIRDYLLYDENNELIAKGSSKWLVYDLKRNFLCSSKGIMEGIEFKKDKAYDDKFDKIEYGSLDEYTFVFTQKIAYTDLDHYNHMNNAKYLLMMMNALRLDENEYFDNIQVDYLNQGYLDHNIDVYKKKVDNVYYLLGKDEEKIIFVIKANIKA